MQPSTGAKAAHIVPLGSHITSLRFCSKRDALAVTASKLTGNIWSGSFFVLGAKADIVQRVEVDHGCSALAWSLHNDNALFVATDDGLIRLWNMEKVHMQRAFDGHNDIITGIAVDPFMHTRFASASYDRTIKVWNADSKADLAELMLDAHNDCVTLVDWNPKTAGVLASGGWDALRLWDIRTKDGKATHFDASSKVLTLGWSSEWLLYYGTEYGAIASLDVRNLSAATATAQVPGDLPVRTLRVNPHDTEQFAAGGDNASTSVYSKSLEKIYGYNGHTDFVATVDWSRAQPGQLASGGFDKSVHLWSN